MRPSRRSSGWRAGSPDFNPRIYHGFGTGEPNHGAVPVCVRMTMIGWRDAASRLVAGEPFKKEAAIAKLYSSTVAVDNAREATQIHGGYGFMNEYPVARMWRDSKILEIGEGTSEVQRMLIARELGFAG